MPRRRRNLAGFQEIIDTLNRCSLSLKDVIEHIITNNQNNENILSDFTDDLPSLLDLLSKDHSSADSVLKWSEEFMQKKFLSEMATLISRKNIYQMPVEHVTSEEILNFSTAAMASDMEENAPMLWKLLGKLLEADARQRRRRELNRQKAGPAPTSVAEDEEVEFDFNLDELDVMLEAEDRQAPPTKRSEASKRLRRFLERFDTLTRVKQQVIISIFMQNSNARCNAFQVFNGLTLHATGTPDLIVQSLAHLGLSVSQSSINNLITALALHQQAIVQNWASTRLLSIAYDNFDKKFNSPEPSLKNPGEFWNATSAAYLRLKAANESAMRISKSLWEDSPLNLYRIRDPPPLHWHMLRPSGSPSSAIASTIELIAWHLREALVTMPEFADLGYKQKLGTPAVRKQIPISKTEQMPAKAMDIKQSTNDGQTQILTQLLMYAGLGDPIDVPGSVDMSDFVFLVHGDLSTYERLLAAIRHRAIESTPFRRLQYVIFVPGLFHFLMACADAIFRALILPKEASLAADSLFQHVGRLRPRETGKFQSGKCPPFRSIHDLIAEDSKVCFRDCWLEEISSLYPEIADLRNFAASKPAWETIEAISTQMVTKYFALNPLFEEEKKKPETERDLEFENSQMKHTLYFMYLEFSKACNAGDIGRVEDIMFPWITVFQAVGKHKYASLLTRHLLEMRFRYPEDLREIIRMNWLCNPTGRENKFRAVDWLVEINNCATKVVFAGSSSNNTKNLILKQSNLIEVFKSARQNMASHFYLTNTTSRHQRPDMTQTHTQLHDHMRRVLPNRKQIGRDTRYEIPNLLKVGLDDMHQLQTDLYDDNEPDQMDTVEDDFAAADLDVAMEDETADPPENIPLDDEDEIEFDLDAIEDF